MHRLKQWFPSWERVWQRVGRLSRKFSRLLPRVHQTCFYLTCNGFQTCFHLKTLWLFKNHWTRWYSRSALALTFLNFLIFTIFLLFLNFWSRHTAVRSYFPNQGSNVCSLQWECRVLTTRTLGKSYIYNFYYQSNLCKNANIWKGKNSVINHYLGRNYQWRNPGQAAGLGQANEVGAFQRLAGPASESSQQTSDL